MEQARSWAIRSNFRRCEMFFTRIPIAPNRYGIGSVKTNIGHTEAVAGIAGLIKVVLAMQHQRLPAHLHFKKPNPQIALDSVPARIPVQTEAWPRTDRPLHAGVSSFGFSGTNAHVIVEQAPAIPATKPRCQSAWLPIASFGEKCACITDPS